MPNDARIGDTFSGTCCCHPPIPCIGMVGIVISGAGKSNVQGSMTSRIGDVVRGACGHLSIITGGSSLTNVEFSSDARIGDPVSGCIAGIIISGASTTNSG